LAAIQKVQNLTLLFCRHRFSNDIAQCFIIEVFKRREIVGDAGWQTLEWGQ
jgi:hypothetical protein